MESWKEKSVKIFLVVINIMLIMNLVRQCFKIEEFNYIFVLLLIILGIIIYLFCNIILNSKRKKIIFFLFISCALGLLIFQTKGRMISEEIKTILLNFKVINTAALEHRGVNFEEFVHIISLTVPLLTAVIIGITQKWRNAVVIFTSAVFIIFWYQIFYKTVLKNISYYIAVTILTVGVNEYIKKNKEYTGREVKIGLRTTEVISILVILSLIIPQIVLIFPQEYKGKTIEGIRTYIRNEFAEGKGKGGSPVLAAINGSYGLKQSGYSDSATMLGGKIVINDNEVFTVKSDKPYYLRGRVSDNYTGKSWLKYDDALFSNEESYKGEAMKKLEQVIGIEEIPREDKTLTISPSKNLKSTSFFTPNGSKNVKSSNDGIYLDEVPVFMSSEEIMEDYTVEYLSFGDYDNYLQGIQNTQYIKIIKDEGYTLPSRVFGEDDYAYVEKINLLLESYKGEESINIISAKLGQLLNSYFGYMKIEASMNEGVYIIVNTILNDEAVKKGVKVEELTNHDKASAIRTYLMENYEYVTNVKNNTQYDDFVSNFLLEEKEGYCTYFATTTVMMCRIAGVPARYVEGFKMSDRKNDEGDYSVTNAEAHAWAEVLINPYRDNWAVVDSAPTPREYEALRDKEQVEAGDTPDINVDNGGQINRPDKNNPALGEDDFNNDVGTTNKIFTPYRVIFGLIIIILCIMSMQWINRIKIIKSNSIIPLYNYYFKRLKTIGIIKNSTEGDLEFIETIKDSDLKLLLSSLVKQTYDEFYGGRVLKNVDKRQYLKSIESYIKDNDKWYKYMVKKYFLISSVLRKKSVEQ